MTEKRDIVTRLIDESARFGKIERYQTMELLSEAAQEIIRLRDRVRTLNKRWDDRERRKKT